MTNEEFEKRVEFILGHQAQFASDIIELKSGIVDLKDVVTRLANGSLRRFEDTDERIAALVTSQIQTDERIAALVSSQTQTDESLRNLIAVVDRYFQKNNGRV